MLTLADILKLKEKESEGRKNKTNIADWMKIIFGGAGILGVILSITIIVLPLLLGNKPPRAIIRHSKEKEIETLAAPVDIYFDANESNDPDDDNDIVEYKWEIRDSKNRELDTTASRTFYYTFDKPDIYTIYPIVKDKGKKTSDTIINLKINNSP